MVNFYEELNLDKNKSIQDLNAELSSLENTWKRREITNPEKATKVLALIIDARKAFQSEASRAAYEKELNKVPDAAPDMDAEREANYQKWKEKAQSHYDNGSYELTRDAIRQALQYRSADKVDSDLSFLYADVLSYLGDYSGAINAINGAILVDPTDPTLYHKKGEIFSNLYGNATAAGTVNDTVLQYLENAKKEYEKALALYRQDRYIPGQLDCMSILAIAYAEVYNSDLSLAEDYARQVLSISPDNADMKALLEQIREDKNTFQPYQGKNHPSSSSGGHCYIATAVYGSYDCPQVWTLRRYRDQKLASSWIGRLFIRCYYAISPHLVKHFGSCGWFQNFWRERLNTMVLRLQEEGFSSDRYHD